VTEDPPWPIPRELGSYSTIPGRFFVGVAAKDPSTRFCGVHMKAEGDLGAELGTSFVGGLLVAAEDPSAWPIGFCGVHMKAEGDLGPESGEL